MLLGLLIWWIVEGMEDDEPAAAVVPAATVPVVDPAAAVPVAATASPAIAAVLANPAAYAGQPFSTGQVRVAQVVSDRGFWVEDNGQRLFVVKNETPESGVADVQGPPDTRAGRSVNAGDMVRIDGTLYTSPDQIQPPLDAQTRQAIEDQPTVLQANVSESSPEAPAPQPRWRAAEGSPRLPGNWIHGMKPAPQFCQGDPSVGVLA